MFLHLEAGEGQVEMATEQDLNRYLISGFDGAEIWVLDVSNPASPRWMTDHAVIPANGEFGAYLEVDGNQGIRCILVTPSRAIPVP